MQFVYATQKTQESQDQVDKFKKDLENKELEQKLIQQRADYLKGIEVVTHNAYKMTNESSRAAIANAASSKAMNKTAEHNLNAAITLREAAEKSFAESKKTFLEKVLNQVDKSTAGRKQVQDKLEEIKKIEDIHPAWSIIPLGGAIAVWLGRNSANSKVISVFAF